MNQTQQPRGRRRKLEPTAKARPPRRTGRAEPGRWLGSGGRWLNQPLSGLPDPANSSSLVTTLSRQRSIAPRYLREAWGEMRQVTWPRFGQAMRLTASVALFAFFFAVLVYAVDWVLTKIFEEVILNESVNIRQFLRDLF